MLRSTALMLDHGLARPAEARALEAAVDVALHETPTPDLGGSASTAEFAHAVSAALVAQRDAS
jgi:3-isopropylmalate dehydrogenase